MIKDITLNASPRTAVGKGDSRRMRTTGMIPAAVYGEGLDPVAVSVNAKELAGILRSDSGHNTIFKLAISGSAAEPATVIVKDWQVDPVKGRLLHADLLRLSLTNTTHVNVPLEVIGEAFGVKNESGILEVNLREIPVECLPGDIPEHLTLDVSGYHVGGHATVGDLVYDRTRIKVLLDDQQIIAGVLPPRLAEPVAVPAVEGAAEPELIKKGKTEE